ncbi:ATP-binding protein [Virgisporangium aurantiacum]|uniref:STAS domain-containing protein n=1 Tax=Virgisporangium aurantiacum TaxID=175570 RepID=A0A8J3YVW4_9ACTN|nr:ATP-binding protein [Virgisporangium aurantiacum]GIJ52546.1 STAS domain-containing protein [Virgisporangium aurantiacum]
MTRLTADVDAAAPGEPVALRVVGTLDAHTAPVLHDALTTLLSTEPEIVALDFTAVTVADGAEASLVTLADQAYAWPGATVVIGGVSRALGASLVRAGNLPSFPTLRDAVAGAAAIRAHQAEAPRLKLGLSPIESAAASARRLVDKACAQWGLPALRDTARLVVTELVSNAVRHGTVAASAAVEVTLTRGVGAVYVSVRDRSRRLPKPGGPVPPTVEGGRGLLVVGIMSRAWGATPTVDGKVVWATLST